jgi:hypothetical protein
MLLSVEPYNILIQVIMPALALDMHNQIASILDQLKARGEEVDVTDGFELYKEMVAVRRFHLDILPG